MTHRLPIRPHSDVFCGASLPHSGRAVRGFTLLELLTVIGIIAALSAIIAVAFSVVGGSARNRQTRTTLESILAMQNEAFSLSKLPSAFKSNYANALDLDGPAYNIDFTAEMAIRLRADQKNHDAEDKMAPADLESLVWTPPTWVGNSIYSKGDYVVGTGSPAKQYIALNDLRPSTVAPSADPANWAETVLPSPIVMLKDGWGNGIRYAGAKLTGVTISGMTNQEVKAPDGRPFWVSAGPDGSFLKGDDNVYSFEN